MAHNNTVLAQLLNLIDQHDLQKLENKKSRPQRKYLTLNRCSQFTTMLILSYMKFLAKLGKTITQIQRLLQLNLFERQDL